MNVPRSGTISSDPNLARFEPFLVRADDAGGNI